MYVRFLSESEEIVAAERSYAEFTSHSKSKPSVTVGGKREAEAEHGDRAHPWD